MLVALNAIASSVHQYPCVGGRLVHPVRPLSQSIAGAPLLWPVIQPGLDRRLDQQNQHLLGRATQLAFVFTNRIVIDSR